MAEELQAADELRRQLQARVHELERLVLAAPGPSGTSAGDSKVLAVTSMADAAAAAASAAARAVLEAQASSGKLPVTTQLRPPNIEKFDGTREKSADFALAVNRRLDATGQLDTKAGLEFAVGHFTGVAATWWRYWSQTHADWDTWALVKPMFEDTFKLVNSEQVYEKRLFECSQTGSVEEYCANVMDICIRLPDLSEGFKMRQFARGACSYLRRVFAERETDFKSLLEMTTFVLALSAKVDPSLLKPDADAMLAPLAAHLQPKKGFNRDSKKPFDGPCWTCGRTGHRKQDCPMKPPGLQNNRKQTGNPLPRARAQFGKYAGAGVHNVEAEEEAEPLSDDELRSGNDQA